MLFDAVNQWSLLIVAPLIYASSIAGASFSLVKALTNVKKQLTSPCLLAMFTTVLSGSRACRCLSQLQRSRLR